MPLPPDTLAALALLERRLVTLLPPEYQQVWESVEPVSMGSAGLKFDAEGRVAWDRIWQSFCDLAMAGGPPHRGTLLSPASPATVRADAARYEVVVAEICRGVRLVTGLDVQPSPDAGWVRVQCTDATMAGWLLRAVVMENVSARQAGRAIDVPVGPAFRVEKEIKNVVTTMAKSCHYWVGHMPAAQQAAIGALFAELDAERPLVVPAEPVAPSSSTTHADVAAVMAEAITHETRLGTTRGVDGITGADSPWLAVHCPGVRTAVWMMRALVAHENLLARREETRLCVPVPATREQGDEVVRRVARVRRLALARGLV